MCQVGMCVMALTRVNIVHEFNVLSECEKCEWDEEEEEEEIPLEFDEKSVLRTTSCIIIIRLMFHVYCV